MDRQQVAMLPTQVNGLSYVSCMKKGYNQRDSAHPGSISEFISSYRQSSRRGDFSHLFAGAIVI